jgi:nitroimidazol reductase NimA-like FMN-containing flavoprotein (pyridoxamine 5'-phosphate oxidase superfamily)
MREDEFIESREEMEEILREEAWGCLGLTADGQSYVVPLNYGYVDGKILFHCGLEGRKLDLIRKNPGVCFTVARQSGDVQDHPGGKPCHVDNDSVICYGTARIVEDLDEREQLLNAFNRVFRPNAPWLDRKRIAHCLAVEITIREMTGRRERGGERGRERTMWRYRP